jgi:lysylphosphatidylglycerol synthetase-like protein (DUF2156 family)
LLSNAADAPYLGEAAILFNLTRVPATAVSVQTGGAIPGFVWLFLAVPSCIGFVLLSLAVLAIRRARRDQAPPTAVATRLQCAAWFALVLTSLICLISGKAIMAILLLMFAQLWPRQRSLKKKVTSTVCF